MEAKLLVVPDPGNNNTGSATWTYSIADSAFDFLAAGETLTLTYIAQVDNNFAPNNETGFQSFYDNDHRAPTTFRSLPPGRKPSHFPAAPSTPGGDLTPDRADFGNAVIQRCRSRPTPTRFRRKLTTAVLSGSGTIATGAARVL